MQSAAAKAFDLAEEPAKLRDAYGRNLFGQGCLLARRLVERGVPFVEVNLERLGHAPATTSTPVKRLCGILDPAWATLMDDLKDRGLLDTTMIVWMGEFGRTPRINQGTGPRPLPERLVDGAGRRRHQGRPGARQDERRRHDGRRRPDRRARLAGDGLPGPRASTTRSRTCRTSAGRSASWTRRRR